MSLIYDKAAAMLKKYRAMLQTIVAPNDDNMFFVSKDCISLRIFLIVLLKRYNGSSEGIVVKFRDLLKDLDVELDSAGMKHTMEEYQKLENV